MVSLLKLHRDVFCSSTGHATLCNPIFAMKFLHLPHKHNNIIEVEYMQPSDSKSWLSRTFKSYICQVKPLTQSNKLRDQRKVKPINEIQYQKPNGGMYSSWQFRSSIELKDVRHHEEDWSEQTPKPTDSQTSSSSFFTYGCMDLTRTDIFSKLHGAIKKFYKQDTPIQGTPK